MITNREISRANRAALACIDEQIRSLCDAWFTTKSGDPLAADFAKRMFDRVRLGQHSAIKRGFLRAAAPLLAARTAITAAGGAKYVYAHGDELSQDQTQARGKDFPEAPPRRPSAPRASRGRKKLGRPSLRSEIRWS